MTFKEYIEDRRKKVTGTDKERRLELIELEAMGIAHRELMNALEVSSALVPRESITMEDLLSVQGMLAGLYGFAMHELIERGEIERPPQRPLPEPTPAPARGGN
jgi:hypothetical protein